MKCEPRRRARLRRAFGSGVQPASGRSVVSPAGERQVACRISWAKSPRRDRGAHAAVGAPHERRSCTLRSREPETRRRVPARIDNGLRPVQRGDPPQTGGLEAASRQALAVRRTFRSSLFRAPKARGRQAAERSGRRVTLRGPPHSPKNGSHDHGRRRRLRPGRRGHAGKRRLARWRVLPQRRGRPTV